MNRRIALTIALDLIAEGLTAIALMAFPEPVGRWLMGAALSDIGILPVRIAGFLLALSVIVCWLAWRRGAWHKVLTALFAYNIGATLVLTGFGVVSDAIGILLWPVTAIHAAIAIWFAFVVVRLKRARA